VGRINRSSKLLLYHQLYEIVRGDILGGRRQPDDMLPPESELIETYPVRFELLRTHYCGDRYLLCAELQG
jgi:DNA-binding FadR family transcriptional regulator